MISIMTFLRMQSESEQGRQGSKEKQTLTEDHRRPPVNRDGKISDRAIKKLLIHLNILNTLKEYA